jgi:hypothetical protein
MRGIHILVSKISSSAGVSHWFYKIPEEDVPGGYWLLNYHVDVEPFSLTELSTAPTGVTLPTGTSLALGGRSGYVYKLDPSVITDDGNAVTSTIFFGPFYASDPTHEGKVTEIVTKLGQSSGTVTLTVHGGQTAHEALAATAFDGCSWSAGTFARPDMRAYVFYLKATSTARWAFENCTIKRQRVGGFQG